MDKKNSLTKEYVRILYYCKPWIKALFILEKNRIHCANQVLNKVLRMMRKSLEPY